MDEVIAYGCPIWNHRAWRGTLYPTQAAQRDYLYYYAQRFRAVEGNSTFYALPSAQNILRWRDSTPEGFRFCFKFPRDITHSAALRQCDAALSAFLHCLEPLHGRLGPLMLQLPAQFGPQAMPRLEAFLDHLPRDFHYAIEVRHPAFFAKGEAERVLNRVLKQRHLERVIFDSRALFSQPEHDPASREALARKPHLPVRATAFGPQPIIRFIGHIDTERSMHYLRQWPPYLQQWAAAGQRPLCFVHTPNNDTAPQLIEAVLGAQL